MFISVEDFLRLFTDMTLQKVVIYSISNHKIIYKGFFGEMPSHIERMVVNSVDTIFEPQDYLTINVD